MQPPMVHSQDQPTNDICIAPRLANLALKSTHGLMKRRHTLKKECAVGAMPTWIVAFSLVRMVSVN